jgi:K(+)-stimulated pyrophosphate-energized sodium pump
MNFDQNLIAPALGVLGLLIVVIIYQWITKQDGGSGAVKKIGEQIHIGAIVFMKREYKMLSIFALVLLVLLYIFLGAASALCFVVGALTSATAGYIGMNTATIANVRTAQAAHDSGSSAASNSCVLWWLSNGPISCSAWTPRSWWPLLLFWC